ncbi:hypothetical protein [Methanobrevibacter sp.]|uniref:hypothetical protein n=1 Tax=Methanobrevibacter sp. TaxID=66852 RepID=UPI003867A0CB
MDIVKLFLDLNIEIQKKFAPLSWVDLTHYDDGTGSISFTDCGEPEDQFFNKMCEIKEFVKTFGYTAELIKWRADCECPYHEATININFHGGEL